MSGSVASIRAADRADIDAVSELLEQLGYRQDDRQATEQRLRHWADDPASSVLVAIDAGDLLGVIAVHVGPFLERDGCWGRIVALVVADRARGRGIGSQLVAAAESFAGERGCVRMEVTSADHRTAAHKFYVRRGYLDQAGTSSRFVRDIAVAEHQDHGRTASRSTT
ncbi:GNAT family N-acetyltransferase [Microlunatus soli]|uniref:Ribosomal protein S18 acetylase RimI n=1 Tax=Microlunatus soli TaxID=630515 RepID=A0A1H1UBE2_9ACTN|nr:GNAT family N-acetyltransferase [Microlunatus soli]SDS69802.1 Ribosomal protein S18 acetylase RimI [Microlunatus soli]